jgi:hypothetical protein
MFSLHLSTSLFEAMRSVTLLAAIAAMFALVGPEACHKGVSHRS